MIRSDRYPQALRALQKLIIHAKAQAYAAGQTGVADLLNDVELLPEYIADDRDRTDDFAQMLEGILEVYPSCRYIVDEFDKPTHAT